MKTTFDFGLTRTLCTCSSTHNLFSSDANKGYKVQGQGQGQGLEWQGQGFAG